MNRLRDDAGADPVAVRGIELLRGTPATVGTPEVRRRVWMSLQRSRSAPVRGVRSFKLRMALVVVGLVCVAGSAGAMLAARKWVMPVLRGRGTPPMRERATAARTHVLPAAPGQEASDGVPAGGVVQIAAALEAPAPSGAARAVAASRASGGQAELGSQAAGPIAGAALQPAFSKGLAARATSTRKSLGAHHAAAASVQAVGSRAAAPVVALAAPAETPAIAAAAVARERTEVLDAMIALRRDHDPAGAGAMLDRYLTVHPFGLLREEALVLAIEAAGQLGDRGAVRSLARSYQLAYPGGRFRQFAENQIALTSH